MVNEKSGNWFKRHKVLTVVLGFVLLFIIIGVTGDPKKTDSKTTSAASTDTAAKAVSATPAPAPTPAPAAQPSVPAEYKSALSKAGSYSSIQHMSKRGIYDQLTSEYGEKFTAPAAQYAIDNLKADYNANALAKAKSYQSQQSMSPAAIHDQLTSDYGEKFTTAEADYAIANL